MGFMKPKIPAMPAIPPVQPLPEPPKYDDAARAEEAAQKRARLRNQRTGSWHSFFDRYCDDSNLKSRDAERIVE